LIKFVTSELTSLPISETSAVGVEVEDEEKRSCLWYKEIRGEGFCFSCDFKYSESFKSN